MKFPNPIKSNAVEYSRFGTSATQSMYPRSAESKKKDSKEMSVCINFNYFASFLSTAAERRVSKQSKAFFHRNTSAISFIFSFHRKLRFPSFPASTRLPGSILFAPPSGFFLSRDFTLSSPPETERREEEVGKKRTQAMRSSIKVLSKGRKARGKEWSRVEAGHNSNRYAIQFSILDTSEGTLKEHDTTEPTRGLNCAPLLTVDALFYD